MAGVRRITFTLYNRVARGFLSVKRTLAAITKRKHKVAAGSTASPLASDQPLSNAERGADGSAAHCAMGPLWHESSFGPFGTGTSKELFRKADSCTIGY